MMSSKFRFTFKPVVAKDRPLVLKWLVQPHVAEWFYGQGLQNTFTHLDEFLQGASQSQYWLAFDKDRPFAFFITSSVSKPHDELTRWCIEEGDAITLDMLIGDTSYLGKGLSHLLIREFLTSQFPHAAEVLIDPEATNSHAIHIYQKVGFRILGEFIPLHSPNPHYMMRLNMKELMVSNYHLEHHDAIPQEYEKILFHEISADAFRAKGLAPIRQFSVFIKDQKLNILGGATGVTFYGSLYVDMLWVDKTLRHQGWGTKLMREAEKIGRERGASFITLNTMDWEALPFYQKLGYSIEFTREGYEKDSKMFMLRKTL
jgi:ribosomal protein S18 acetylase RimI-like enzyme